MECYVISPNAYGDGNIEGPLETMYSKHCVLMGWWDDNPLGKQFANLKKGDVVIVAQRQDYKFYYYFMGKVCDDAPCEIEEAQCRYLDNFLRLDNIETPDFLKDWSAGGMRPRAIVRIIRKKNEKVIQQIKAFWEKAMKEEEQKKLVYLLEQKKNLILQGAPGTGKTYQTASLALSLTEPDFQNILDHSNVMKKYNEHLVKIDTSYGERTKGKITEGQIAFVTFHQSMEYEDFIEGIKPVSSGANVSYEIQNGIFKMMAKRASDNSDKNFVLIIDEINRGNLSKIFGELITLLEADKREGAAHPVSVTLPYSKEQFSVPSNLYIIGTMNTTDRSVGNIDYAIRRRFAFVTIEADRNVVEENSSDEALDLFDAVQEFIGKNCDSELDIEDLKIGHSYFLVSKNDNGAELETRWKYEILPLLREYYKDGIITKDIPKENRTIESFREL